MKIARLSVALCLSLLVSARADLTIVQKVEGAAAGLGGDITIKIKGDKARIDATPQISTIIDGQTGEMVTLMKEQKTVVRMSADKMKAAADMINKFTDKKVAPGAATPKPTGKKATINGYETEEYVCETPMFKAAYWIAPGYPNGGAILKQLQAVKAEIWNSASATMPDYHVFPGLPIKTVVMMGTTEITTTLISVKMDPLSDEDFSVPKDFQEMKMPDLGTMLRQPEKQPATNAPPHP
jgi:hypothetical protein